MNSWKLFCLENPAYRLFKLLALKIFANHSEWPNVFEYNQLLQATSKNIISGSGKSVCFVEQIAKSFLFEEQYEPRIYLTGEIPSRQQSWHDFFNMLIWLSFPHTKSSLNNLQYHALKQRRGSSSQRSSLENMLTLFDENGVVVISHDEDLLSLIKNFEWKKLFWDYRERVKSNLRCLIFGHSLHEKFLNPYIGMTGHALLIKESSSFFVLPEEKQLQKVDLYLMNALQQQTISTPKDLQPFPILGMPDWFAANAAEAFYDDASYFRPRSSRFPLP